MNKHVNKNKHVGKSAPRFVKAMDRPDAMPKEVATELLLRAPLTGGLRRTCNAARADYYCSDLTPIPKGDKLVRRFAQSTWAQLQKWLRRAYARRAECQAAYETVHRRKVKMESDPSKPEMMARAALAGTQLIRLEKLMEQIEIFRDAAEDECINRRTFVGGLARVAPTVARKLKKELCPSSK